MIQADTLEIEVGLVKVSLLGVDSLWGDVYYSRSGVIVKVS